MSFRTFATRIKALLPDWLYKGEGELVWFVLNIMLDGFADRMLHGLYARFPTYAPPDALSYIGADRRKIRGVGESRDSYVARLLGWLERPSHPTRGGPFAICHEIRDYCGGEGIQVRFVDRRGNWFTVARDGTETYELDTGTWDWDPIPASPDWARFWIIIYPSYTATDGFRPWGRPALLDGSWPLNGSQVFSTDAAPSEIDVLRQIVDDWKAAGRRCEWIIYYFANLDSGGEADAFDPSAPAPDGTWYLWSTGDGSDENRRPPIGADAAYIKGGQTVTPYGAMIP